MEHVMRILFGKPGEQVAIGDCELTFISVDNGRICLGVNNGGRANPARSCGGIRRRPARNRRLDEREIQALAKAS